MKKLLLAALICLAPFSAQAAVCYWVAGSTWNNAANWSATNTGGSGGTCTAPGGIPSATIDVANLDTASPAATTLTLDIDVSISQLNMNSLTGGSGFDASTHNITLNGNGFAGTGSGTRSLNLGSGIWTIPAGGVFNLVTSTGLTFTAGTATLRFAGGTGVINFFGGGKSFATNAFVFNSNSASSFNIAFENNNIASDTIGPVTVNAPANIFMRTGATLTVTGGFAITGTAANPVLFATDSYANTAFTLAVTSNSTCTWCVFKGVTGSTSTITATNSLSLGNTSGTLSISTPTGGGGGSAYIIGGQ